MNTHVSRRSVAAVITTLAIVCGATAAATPAGAADGVSTWSDLRAAVASGGTVQLSADIQNAATENLELGSTPVTLDLNGHGLQVAVRDVEGAAGIRVGPDADLTIRDSAGGGVLDASAGDGGAGIGGNGSPGDDAPLGDPGAGKVTIESGKVLASGGIVSGAGIGGGAWGDGACAHSAAQDGGTTIKSVTIRGGNVTVRGGVFAAGIGGSDCAPPPAGPIVISGGTVSAQGGSHAAAIGGGESGDNGNVEISGAAVTASGGSRGGAGIGGGELGDGGTVHVGPGAKVTATGGDERPGSGVGTGVGAGAGGDPGVVQVDRGGTLVLRGSPKCASKLGSCTHGIGTLTNAGRTDLTDTSASVSSADVFDNSGTVNLINTQLTGDGTIRNAGIIRPDALSYMSANVTPNNYTLDLDLDDGTAASTIQVYAATIADSGQSLPVPPSMTGRGSFIGWFPEPSAGAGVTSGRELVDDTSDLATVLGQSGPTRATVYARYSTVPPRVDGVSPASGKVGGGNTVTITGEAFYGTTKVLFGQTPASSFAVGSHSTMTAVVPAHTRGVVDVRVMTKYGTSPVAAADRYTYRASSISSITPAVGPAPGGAPVTISGTDLTDATSVTFGNTPAATFKVSGSTLVATTPAGSVGQTVDVTVSGPSGTATVLDGYRYVAPPVVTSLTVNQGKAAGGDAVVISGSGLGENPTVTFGTVKATVVSRSDGQLTVTTPAGARGAVDVRVRTPGGISPVVTADRYTYRLIAISTVTPTEGPLGGTNSVTISGNDLGLVSSVTFGGVDASFSLKGSTLVAVAPARTTGDTVDIAVTSPFNGTVKAGAYRYLATPTVTGLSTSSGSTAGGDTVTITGTSFGKAPLVYFGSKTATIVSKTDTTVTVKTPATPRSVVDVRVRTVGGTSSIVDADQFSFVNRTAISPS